MGKINLFKALVFFLVVFIFGILFLKTPSSTVKAGCASGYSCSGSTVQDIYLGCKDPPNQCSQDYIRNAWITCDSNCAWTRVRPAANGKCVSCRGVAWTQSGNCCESIPEWCGDGSCNGDEDCSCSDCSPCCSASAPTISSLAKVPSSSTWRLTWSGGSGNTRNVYIGTSQSAVEANCPSGCTVKAEGLASGTTTYDVSGLTPGNFYYSRVVAYNDAGCNSASATNTALSSCDVSPSSLSIEVGQSATLSTTVSDLAGGTVSYSKSGAFVNISPPASDNSYTYATTVTGVSAGSGTVTNTIASPACIGSSVITVLNPGPWWQSVDGDVTTNGDLLDGIPFVGSLYMSAIGPGGYPGIPAYGGTTDVASDKVSETGWIANTTSNATKVFNSTFFFNSVPADVTPTQVPSSTEDGTTFTTLGTEEGGYYWYEYDSTNYGGVDLTLTNSFDVGTRKVILLVKGADVLIQGDINLTDGSGFFLMVAGEDSGGNGGNILVDSGVGGGGPNLEGIYVSDNQFATGVAATQLYIHGTVAAYGGVSLERDLGGPTNATTPAEVFEYAPELELLYPSKLGTRAINWQEVAP